MKMNKEFVALTLAVIILVSTLLVHLPLVSAAFTVGEHCMPPDSDLEPVCALKTMVNGYFYIPNYDVDVLKVEFLFDDSGLVGDQIGGASPYPTICQWPDNITDGQDYQFVKGRVGEYEGSARWNYMTDVNGDTVIDGTDYQIVKRNLFHSGNYIYDLAGVTVVFNTGYEATPDDGNITIPDGARSFNVSRNGSPIGAMITFWGTRTPPIAYSTTFEFKAPTPNASDLDKEVWYYVLARVYVPSELSRQSFYFVATANDAFGVQNVKLNAYSKAGSGNPVNIGLGTLYSGFHLLEFEFVDYAGSGSINFHVATANGTYAWLDRFHVYVPNYSDNTYRYNVTTTTWCSMKDDYFLIGYADDFIDDVCVDGLVWQDWMWDMGEYGTIYAWGDGFCYPLGNLENNTGLNAYTLNFKFGEIWGSGLLDLQYVSWTKQQDRIWRPRFYAESDVNIGQTNYNAQITEKKLYGGSQ